MQTKYVTAIIRITKEQKEMISSSPINLSKFVRMKIDEEFGNTNDISEWCVNENS